MARIIVSSEAGNRHNPWRKPLTWQVIPVTADVYCVTQYTLENEVDYAQVILPALTRKEAYEALSLLYRLQDMPGQRWSQVFRAKLVDLAGTSKFLAEFSFGVDTMACHQHGDPVTAAEAWFADLMNVPGNLKRLEALK